MWGYGFSITQVPSLSLTSQWMRTVPDLEHPGEETQGFLIRRVVAGCRPVSFGGSGHSWTWSEWLQRQHRQSARLSARVPLASQVQWFLKVFKGWTPGVSSLSLLSGAPPCRVSDTRVFWHLSLLLNISGHGPVKNQQWLKQKPCLQSEAFQFSRWGLGEGTEVTADPWHGTVDINSPYSKVVMLVGTWPSRSLQELHPNAWSHGLDCCFQNQCSCEVSGQSSAMQGTKASLMRSLPCICQASPSHCIL